MSDSEGPPPPQHAAGDAVPAEFQSPPPRRARRSEQFVSYPRAVRLPELRTFRLETVGVAWSRLLKRPALWFVNGLTMAIAFAIYVFAQFRIAEAFASINPGTAGSDFIRLLLIRLASGILLWLAFLLYFGFSMRMALKQVDGLDIGWRGSFNGEGKGLRLLAFAVVGAVLLGVLHVVFVGAPVLVLPFMSFVAARILDAEEGVWDAFGMSFGISAPNYASGLLLWFFLLMQATLTFGVLGIGLAFGAPVVVLAMAENYRCFCPVPITPGPVSPSV